MTNTKSNTASGEMNWSVGWMCVLIAIACCVTGTAVGQEVPSIEQLRAQIVNDWNNQNFNGTFANQGNQSLSISNALSTNNTLANGVFAPTLDPAFVDSSGMTGATAQTNFGYPAVQLTRGDKSYEISFQAFQQSGFYAQAIQQSPTLQASVNSVFEQKFQVQRWQNYAAANQRDIQLNQSGGFDGDQPDVQEAQAKLLSQQQSLIPQIQEEVTQAQTRLAQAQTNFAFAIQEIGLNGAQIAAVRRTNSVTSNSFDGANQVVTSQANPSEMTGEFVMLKANGRSSSNSGYSITRTHGAGYQGVTTVPSEYLLPTPATSDDPFYSLSLDQQRMPDGVMLNVTDDAETNPIVRLNAAPYFSLFYDSGKAPDLMQGNFAKGIFLDGSDNPAAGQTGFSQGNLGDDGGVETPLNLVFDTQMLNVAGYSVQLFADANNNQDFDELDIEHFGVRLYNRTEGTPFEGWSLVIGKTNSLFSPADLRPNNIQFESASLIGYGERPNNELAQLGLHIPINQRMKWRIAIEEPYEGDLAFTGGTEAAIAGNLASTLKRWPTFSSNLEIGTVDSGVVFGSAVRNLGYQGVTGEEFFDSAWGLSAIGRVKRGNRTFFMGVSGGDGIGDYIQGVTHSAIVGDASFDSLKGCGSFVGFQNTRLNCNTGGIYDQFNFAYGYSWMETPGILGVNANRKFQQAWLNYQRQLNSHMAVGLQYEYGFRQVAGGDLGDNNRFAITLSFRSGATEQSTRVTAGLPTYAIAPGPGGLDSDLMAANASNTPVRMNGNPIQASVQQTQRGGSAYLQRF